MNFASLSKAFSESINARCVSTFNYLLFFNNKFQTKTPSQFTGAFNWRVFNFNGTMKYTSLP
jgi:hypothetical protein